MTKLGFSSRNFKKKLTRGMEDTAMLVNGDVILDSKDMSVVEWKEPCRF